MARVKVQVMQGNGLPRSLTLETEATKGAIIGKDLYFADGSLVTLATLAAAAGKGSSGSTSSNGTSLSTVLTTDGDLITREVNPVRLPIGADNTYLRVVTGLPAWSAPGALTKTDDTNVTLTLGGTPADALLRAASLTLGWTGTLGVARGGTNIASYTAGDILYASGGTTLAKLGIGAAGEILRVSGGAPAWQAPSTLTNNPSAQVGLAAVNGTALTFMRSDAAPALDQAITPTWTNLHTFNAGIVLGGTATLKGYTVAALPAGMAGQLAYVTDATLTMITGLGLPPVGGGANKVPVFHDGTNWLIL